MDKRPRLGTRLAGPCELHGRCICEACRSAKRQPLLRLCCRRHHSASDPGMVDFCESHRRTPCARCQVIPSSADVCCRKGHHDAPPPHTSSFSLESGQPVNTSPNKASPPQLRTPVLRPSRRRPRDPESSNFCLGNQKMQPRVPRSEPAAVLLGSPASSPKGAPVALALAAAAAAAATATRKRLPVAEGTPPLHRKRRPPNACASTPQRRKPTILQLLGKRQRPPGASEDAAPPGPEAPQTGAWARAG